MTFAEFRERLAGMGRNVDLADLSELGRFVVSEIKAGKYVIGHDLESAGTLLRSRATRSPRATSPRTAISNSL